VAGAPATPLVVAVAAACRLERRDVRAHRRALHSHGDRHTRATGTPHHNDASADVRNPRNHDERQPG
jgi:hypothetical protein